jgi:excisionase family DNA binding protein
MQAVVASPAEPASAEKSLTLTVPAAAKMLGVSTSYLYQIIREDRCPVAYVRVGTRVVILRRPLEELLGLADHQ